MLMSNIFLKVFHHFHHNQSSHIFFRNHPLILDTLSLSPVCRKANKAGKPAGLIRSYIEVSLSYAVLLIPYGFATQHVAAFAFSRSIKKPQIPAFTAITRAIAAIGVTVIGIARI